MKVVNPTANNTDKQMEFIYQNLANIRQCLTILETECKMDTSQQEKSIMSHKNKIGMEKRFDHLLKSLEMDGCYRGSVVHVNVCDAKRAASGGEWSLAVQKMRTVINDIKPFDIVLSESFDNVKHDFNAKKNEFVDELRKTDQKN